MNIDPLSFLAHLLLSITVGTLVVSLIAYAAYKVRENRKPSSSQPDSPPSEDSSPIFLKLYVPPSSQRSGDH